MEKPRHIIEFDRAGAMPTRELISKIGDGSGELLLAHLGFIFRVVRIDRVGDDWDLVVEQFTEPAVIRTEEKQLRTSALEATLGGVMLGGVDFGRAFNASGARGFYGEGRSSREYAHHSGLSGLLGLDYRGSTFVSKTVTARPNAGNMPLDAAHRPRRLLPDCVVVKPFRGVVLNAVGLSNPGIDRVLATGKWAARTDPFVVSFMAIGNDQEDKLNQTATFALRLEEAIAGFKAPVAVQVNFSCPNIDHGHGDLAGAFKQLDILRDIGVPLMAKVNLLEPVENIMAIGERADALVTSNTLPYGQLPKLVDWEGMFGADSPLLARGYSAGGLSGKPLLPLVYDQLCNLRAFFTKPIVAGGGVLSSADAKYLLPWADGVELGVVGMIRPWRVRRIVRAVNSWGRE